MPREVAAFPWGSRSRRRARYPLMAREAARLTALVVLPTPPFWLMTAIMTGEPGAWSVSRETAGAVFEAETGGVSRETLGRDPSFGGKAGESVIHNLSDSWGETRHCKVLGDGSRERSSPKGPQPGREGGFFPQDG